MTTPKTTPKAGTRAKVGTRGPVPKRSRERRRRNKDTAPEAVAAITDKVEVPKPSSKWHPLAKEWFASLSGSGQSQFYEPSDWQAARFVAEAMSINLRQQKKFSAMLFTAIWSAMGDLLSTEAARRRVRMEIERGAGEEEPASVTAIADYKARLAKG